MDVDFGISIFQLTVARSHTQIDPATQKTVTQIAVTQIAVTQKTMMLFVGVRFDDGGLDFADDLDRAPQRYSIFQGGMIDDACSGPE